MTGLSPTDLGTILGVWAHPDDETYLSGGLMGLARQSGQRVVVVTATRGEAGTSDPARLPSRRLAAIREAELHASLDALGVTEHRFFDYVDGTLADQDMGQAIAQVAAVVADVRPDTIITFGPDGLTGHVDHRRVSTWTTVARELAAPDARLLYATTTAPFVDRWQDLHDRFDIYLDPDLPLRISPDRAALEITLDGVIADRKFVALRAQATQTADLIAAMGEAVYRAWTSIEMFREALSMVPRDASGRTSLQGRKPAPVTS